MFLSDSLFIQSDQENVIAMCMLVIYSIFIVSITKAGRAPRWSLQVCRVQALCCRCIPAQVNDSCMMEGPSASHYHCLKHADTQQQQHLDLEKSAVNDVGNTSFRFDLLGLMWLLRIIRKSFSLVFCFALIENKRIPRDNKVVIRLTLLIVNAELD